jgi:high frequency lysogenization protein
MPTQRDPLRDQVLALAGLFQAARLVQQVARTGMTEATALQASIDSIFARNPESVEAVYGGVGGVALGLEMLSAQLQPRTRERNLELTRYVVVMLHHERALSKHQDMLKAIGERLDQVQAQVNYFSSTHPNVLASLAALYSDTLAKLTPRILVFGEQSHLTNPENVNRVRALLLAGIRSAILWRQKGGSRLKLLWNRRAILDQTRQLLRGLR